VTDIVVDLAGYERNDGLTHIVHTYSGGALRRLTSTTHPATDFKVTKGMIAIACSFDIKDRASRLPSSKWNKPMRRWTVSATPTSAANIIRAFEDVKWTADTDFMRLLDEYRSQTHAADYRVALDLPDHPSKKPSWGHQRQAYEFISRLNAGGVFAAQGTGKSKIVVDILANRTDIHHVLIIAKKKGIGVWPREFRRFSIRKFKMYRLEPPLTTEQRAATITDTWDPKKDQVYVVNYDVAWREPLATVLLSHKWDAVVCDEAQKIKSAGSNVSMFASKLGDRVPVRYATTGTPMHDKPIDVYGIYRFLDKGVFGTNKAKFEQKYVVKGGFGGFEILGYTNLEELSERMYSIAFRVTDEVLDLPKAHHIVLPYSLSPQESTIYKKMVKDFIASTEFGSTVAPNILTKMLRLQQIASGFIKDDKGEEHDVGSSELETLEEALEDFDPTYPVVVFCQFIHNIDRVKELAAKLGRRYGEISGRRADLTKDATMPPNIDLMCVQIQAGGDSIDLTRVNRVYYFDLCHSLGDYDQSWKRVHRPGQRHRTYFHYLVAEGTVKAQMYQALIDKRDPIEYVHSYWKDHTTKLLGD